MARISRLVTLTFVAMGIVSCSSKPRAIVTSRRNACEYGDARWQTGTFFRSLDGCHDCSCRANGEITCTTRTCSTDAGAHTDAPSEGADLAADVAGDDLVADVAGDDLASVSTLAIDFAGAGAHVFAAEWLVFQPNESGSVDVTTEIGSSWSTHPRAVEAQSLSMCGAALNEDESIRNLQAAGFPESPNPALVNLRSVQISEVSPTSFCTGVHHANGTWTFLPTPVLPMLDPGSGLAVGTRSMSEDEVDLVAVLFDGDAVVRALEYQTSP